ncbi:hypothetical protein MBR110_00340 [Burkholderia sp. MBR-1]|nr:hypothetical protein MBR110_00340 [Burkholderia sp. MBR-1]
MGGANVAKKMSPEIDKVDVDALKKAIGALESSKAKREREREALFAGLYDVILGRLDRDVSKRQILDQLAEYGLPLTYDQFDNLLAAEATRRGDPVPDYTAKKSKKTEGA